MKQDFAKSVSKGIIKSFGLVFDDIGTSAVYIQTVIFALIRPTLDYVMGTLTTNFVQFCKLRSYKLQGNVTRGETEPGMPFIHDAG
jgi:K+ transporter